MSQNHFTPSFPLNRSALVVASLLASTHFAEAQGTSGATGAVASIPSSVVRAREQGQTVTQRGLFSIITSSTPPGSDAGSNHETIRPREHPLRSSYKNT